MGFAIGIGNGLHLRGNIINNFLINKYPGAVGAYSLRKLSINTTNVIRVRRSSDNSENDFTASEVENGVLTNWVGAGNGLVTTLYDQSENNNNATQATASSQPKIVDAGVLVTESGRPAISFDGIDDYIFNSFGQEYSQPVSYFLTMSANTSDGKILGSLSSIGDKRILFYIQNNQFTPFAGTINLRTGTELSAYPYSLQTLLFNTTQSKWYINGVKENEADAGNNTTDGVSLGAYGDGSLFSKMLFQELIIYASDQSANRTAIENNINKMYNIY